MTREQLDKLSRLLTETASDIELRALAGGVGRIAGLASEVRGNCVVCMRLVDGLSEVVCRG